MTVCKYDISAEFDLKAEKISGSVKVVVHNVFEKPLRELMICFKLPPYGKEERLSVELDEERLSLICAEELDPLFEKEFLIELPDELQPRNELKLVLKFCGRLHFRESRGIMYLGDYWYPRIVFGKEYVGDYVARLLVSRDFRLVSSGRELSISSTEKNMREYVIESYKTWKFGLVLGKGLDVYENEVRGVQIKSYFISETKKWANILLENACDAVDFYISEFGFYPHRSLSIVPGLKGPIGGYPVATNLVAIHDLDKLGEKAFEFSKWIVAHEIGHMYWGHYVLSSTFPDWLMIGLGIYMDRHYSEARGLSLDRYRRCGEKGPKILSSFIDRYLYGVRKGYDTTIAQPVEKLMRAGFDWNNIVVHGKGYSIISMLEQLLGKEVFRKIHDNALRKYAYREFRIEDFKKLCEEISGQDLEWFFYQWLYTNRVLSYKITEVERTRENNVYRIKVTVKRFGDAVMPIPVAVFFENGEEVIKWTNRRLRVNVLVFESKNPVEKIELDPDRVLPIIDPSELPVQTIIEQISLNFRRFSFSAVADFYEVAVEKNIKDTFTWFCLGLSLYDVKRYREAQEAFKRVLKLLNENPKEPLVVWSYIWIGHILDVVGEREKAIEMYRKAINTGNKAVFQFAQYDIGPVDAISWANERLKKPFKRIDRILL